jgi:hypothetical protein
LPVDFASRPSKKILIPDAGKVCSVRGKKTLARMLFQSISDVIEHTPRRSADSTANTGMVGEFEREVQLRW